MSYDVFKNINPLLFSSNYFNDSKKNNLKIYIASFHYNFIKLILKQSFFFFIQKFINKKISINNYKNIFFSVTNINNINGDDEFFGTFPNNFDNKIIINVDIRIARIRKKNTVSLIAQIKLLEFFKIIFDQYKVLKNFHLNKIKNDIDISVILNEIKNNINSYLLCNLISKLHKNTSIYYIFENEPWERALMISLNYYNKSKNSFAFTHTLISKNNYNYSNISELQNLNAFPCNIIFTGRYNLKNFLDISKIDLKKDNIKFFFTNSNKLNKSISFNRYRNKKILFLIDDVIYIEKLYQIMINLFMNNNFEILYSFNIHDKKIINAIKKYNFSMFKKLNFFSQNYIDTYFVVYNSTSLSLEFYKAGYKLAYYDFYENKDYDPLSNIEYNKYTFRSYEDLLFLTKKEYKQIDRIKLYKGFLKYFGNNSNFKLKEIKDI